ASSWRLIPIAEGFDVGGGAVAQPAIQLRLILELLAAQAGYDHKTGFDVRQSCHVDPEFFELGYGKDILLAVTPPLLNLFESDVGWHLGGEMENRSCGFQLIPQRSACQAKNLEELFQINPASVGVVVSQYELIFFPR